MRPPEDSRVPAGRRSGGRHLYIAGFMGTGKSTVGAALAKHLNLPFIDLDDVVAAQYGRSIVDIFRDEGEAAFRQYETAALEKTAAGPPSVIALGGGAPTVDTNADIIRATGHTILLTADWRSVWNRIRGENTRPLLNPAFTDSREVPDIETFIRHAEPIRQRRLAAYQAVADMTIDTSLLSIRDVVDTIIAWLASEGNS